MGGKYDTGGAGKDSNMMYDDGAFQLFLFALLSVYWIPSFLFRLVRFFRRATHVKTPLEEAQEAWCGCSECQEKAEHHRNKGRGLSAVGFGDIFFVIITLLLIFTSLTVYRANLTAETPFDPFAILDVTETATPKQIKKAYRRLSVVHHPDKNRDDPTAGERFIKITKAFAALTDDAAKENFVKYGNPDGYMGTTLGLGLPEVVAESRNIVLVLYFLLIVVLFPVVVGVWWRKRSKQFTTEIMTSTFMLYQETLQTTTRFRDLLAAFCGSHEFSDLYTSDNDEALMALSETLKKAGKSELRKTKSVAEPTQAQVQNLLIMTAYLARFPIPKKLHYALQKMLRHSEALLTSMTDIVGIFQRPDCEKAWDKTLVRGHTVFLSTCISLAQCTFQALDEKVSPFLQIPHFTEREVKYCTGSRSPTIRSIYDLMKLDMSEQRTILRGLSDGQFLDVRAFLDRFPSASLHVSEPTVEGEDDGTVHSGDNVTIRAKLTIMRRSGSAFSPHVPNLPFRKEEAWWVWLADQRLMCPLEVKRLLPKMAKGHNPNKRRKRRSYIDCCSDDDDDEDEHGTHQDSENKKKSGLSRLTKDPRVTVFKLKFRFMAPQPGQYNLEVKTACDCYMGASKTKLIKLNVLEEVEPPPQDLVRYFDTDDEESQEEEEEEEDESEDEEEEDSEGEYEYVTDDDTDGEGDFEDEYGITEGAKGDPAS